MKFKPNGSWVVLPDPTITETESGIILDEATSMANAKRSNLSNHIAALYKYVQIYDAENTHTEDEEILYTYCMQIEDIIDIINFTKEQEDEKETNDKD